MRVLITGGAGYIGSILTPLLLQEGYHVTVVDNLLYRQTTLLNCFGHPRFRFIRGDAADVNFIQNHLAKHDFTIALAAIVGAPACELNPSLAKLVNYDAIKLILKNLSKDQALLYPNTNSGYGVGQKGKFCTESTPLRPISYYGKLKAEIEKELLASERAVSFRLATVFGVSPRMRLDLLVNDFTYRACHDKAIVLFEEHFKRNFIHVYDVARAFLFGMENFSKMRGDVYNIGLTDENLSKLELCQKIKKYVPEFHIHSAPIGKDSDQRNYIVSSEKIERLGWRPIKSLDDGIQELVEAYSLIRNNSFANV